MYKVISIFDSLKHFEEGVKEYEKRFGKNIELIKLKPSKKDNKEEVKKEETKKLIEILEHENAYKILLDIQGKHFNTEELTKIIEQKKQSFSNIIFIIGGVYGYQEDLYKYVDMKLSLSSLTFPHGLALLILFEQIYRMETIMIGKKYHY
ncbi:23S rRNA (pseudouridine(1915)-N(3))-methyltransferase RlmH [Candidatus Gracilibacteria bacterium]|nr:23S rRNA (pseudouridine(1915)-N(3))-methyltransferase RlmH [Candidatus Gracilibacteria bacterium]NUJ98524.1 23S rRNA (pseudouridine(1915)-N(3))-methyltransferase RlmH [Candidatus Gracilibacteria bacterium]